MKVLFISVADLPDYQSDMVFHGLRNLLGENCVDSNEMWYMYSELKDKYWNMRAPNNGNSYGRGFTMCGTLSQLNIDRTNIEEKIKDKFFDKIIYGSVHRCLDYLDIVLQLYNKKDIIFIDGEDHAERIQYQLIDKGIYFKRELIYDREDLYPINFCIPAELIVDSIPTKEQDYATIIPGDLETYIFDKQIDYYKDYQKSYYGVTFRKGGWDCLRHYEIIMNGCMPYFPDLDMCPKRTMERFPKQLIIKNNKHIQNGGSLETYYDDIHALLDYCRVNLTTINLANYVLSI